MNTVSAVEHGASLKTLKKAVQYTWERILFETDYHKSLYIAAGWLAFIMPPFYYVLWTYIFPQPYESLLIRIIATAGGIPLILKNHWPRKWVHYQPIYWYCFVVYELAFFFTFAVIANEFVVMWGMTTLVAYVFLVLMLEWFTLLVTMAIGILLSTVVYLFVATDPTIPSYGWIYIVVYLFTLIAGAAFNYKKGLLEQEKMEGMAQTTGIVAHELRTPLLSLKAAVGGIQKYLPPLIATYETAKQHNIEVPLIKKTFLKALEPTLKRMDNEITYSNTIIDMLLTSARGRRINAGTGERHSIIGSINESLNRYPFPSAEDRALVHWAADETHDFIYAGSEALINHVMFNLIRNALYFIRKAGKGEMSIQLEPGKDFNKIIFKDTGQGIEPDMLPHIFERFRTSTTVGMGVGLYFCKLTMESLGGDIICESKYGEYAQFTLLFPVVNK